MVNKIKHLIFTAETIYNNNLNLNIMTKNYNFASKLRLAYGGGDFPYEGERFPVGYQPGNVQEAPAFMDAMRMYIEENEVSSKTHVYLNDYFRAEQLIMDSQKGVLEFLICQKPLFTTPVEGVVLSGARFMYHNGIYYLYSTHNYYTDYIGSAYDRSYDKLLYKSDKPIKVKITSPGDVESLAIGSIA